MNQLRLFGIVLRCSNVHTSTFKNEGDTLKRFFVLLSVAHSFLSARKFDETRHGPKSNVFLRQCSDNITSLEVQSAHNQIISASIFLTLSVVRTRKGPIKVSKFEAPKFLIVGCR